MAGSSSESGEPDPPFAMDVSTQGTSGGVESEGSSASPTDSGAELGYKYCDLPGASMSCTFKAGCTAASGTRSANRLSGRPPLPQRWGGGLHAECVHSCLHVCFVVRPVEEVLDTSGSL